MVDFFIKRDDREPKLQAICVDENGEVIDLTAAIGVTFNMINPGEDSPKITAATGTIVSPATDGVVEYAWAAGDTDTEGDYDGEFEVAWSAGTKTTFPNFRYIKIRVVRDIA